MTLMTLIKTEIDMLNTSYFNIKQQLLYHIKQNVGHTESI